MPYRFVEPTKPKDKMMAPDAVHRDGYHECWPCEFGRYRMIGAWIDTDNRVWSEPYHLYTEPYFLEEIK